MNNIKKSGFIFNGSKCHEHKFITIEMDFGSNRILTSDFWHNYFFFSHCRTCEWNASNCRALNRMQIACFKQINKKLHLKHSIFLLPKWLSFENHRKNWNYSIEWNRVELEQIFQKIKCVCFWVRNVTYSPESIYLRQKDGLDNNVFN